MLRRSFLQLCLSVVATFQLFRGCRRGSPEADALFCEIYGKSFAELCAANRQDAKIMHELTVVHNVCQALVAKRTVALIINSDGTLGGNIYTTSVAQVAHALRGPYYSPARFAVISLAEGRVCRHYGPWPSIHKYELTLSHETPSECIRVIGRMASWHPEAFPSRPPLRLQLVLTV